MTGLGFVPSYDHWGGLPVHFLVIETEHYIVFLDHALDVDWKTSDAYDEANKSLAEGRARILNQVARLEAVPLRHIDKDIRTSFRRMLAEAVASALVGEQEAAQLVLNDARQFIGQRTGELARFWYVGAALCTAAAFAAAYGLVWFGDPTAASDARCLLAGSLGALLSVLQRTKVVELDSEAGPRMHRFDGFVRIVVGALAGGVVCLAVDAGLILGAISRVSADEASCARLLLAVVGGASERLIPDLVSKMETEALK